MKNRIKIYFRTAAFCIRSLKQLNLGDVVIYQGRRWVISNGVSRPLWALAELNGQGYQEHVHENDFRKVRSLSNAIHDIRSTWRFYSGYWFAIWLSALNGNEQCAETMRHMPVPRA